VEGGELAILRNLLDLLSRLPETLEIVAEVWPDKNTIEVLRCFEKNGFNLYGIPNSYALEFYVHPNWRLSTTTTSELLTAKADIVLSRQNLKQFIERQSEQTAPTSLPHQAV